ncbi:hypothetical protein D3C71_1579570 [compost metagenome]
MLRNVFSTFCASGGKRIFTAAFPKKPSFAERRSVPLDIPISRASLIPKPISDVLGVPAVVTVLFEVLVLPVLVVTLLKIFLNFDWLYTVILLKLIKQVAIK